MSIFSCVPMLMYHHVNNEPESSVSITPAHFEEHMSYLAKSGYRSLHLSEFYQYIDKINILDKLVLITFDDGYADNYINAYPILKKYKMKATIFPVTAFIKEKIVKRNTKLLSNSETLMRGPFEHKGMDEYLTWEEMKEMEAGGLVDIQAHCHTHGAYFESDKIVSFYDGSVNPKLVWATDGDLRPGIPIYKMGPMLCLRRYFDDSKLRNVLAGHVKRKGGVDFMKHAHAKDKLLQIVKEHGDLSGKFETEREADHRIMGELLLTKKLIEIHLRKKAEYICWPWGSVDKQLIARAKRAGFLGGIGSKEGLNMKLTNRMDIHRFNASDKDIPGLKQKLYKHSRSFYSIYNDKRLDDLLIPVSKFK